METTRPSRNGTVDLAGSPTAELARRFLPVVVGARVGDAMGSPVEGLTFDEIEARSGWIDRFTGDGTDDSLMATLLGEALLAGGGHARADGWAAELVRHRDLIDARRDRFFPSVLHTVEKLGNGYPPRRVAAGNMASSSSAMCIWPVGLVNAGDPGAAAAQAYGLASLLHEGEADFCQDAAAAVAAAVAAGMRPGIEVDQLIAEAVDALDPESGAPMRGLIRDAVALARGSSGYVDFRERYVDRFRQRVACDSRETVPAAFALTILADGDLRRGVELGANFGRDTDTIASMTGALCGSLAGPDSIPETWIAALGPAAVADAQTLADRLAELARAKVAERERLNRTVPGLADG
jgi:ADP-ribosylglycohydrolase